MDEADLDVEGDDLFGLMRLVLGTLGAIILPVWLIMSVVVASASPQIRYFDGDPENPAEYLYVFDDETGERVRAERTHLQRLTIAGTRMGGIFFMLGVAASPLVLLWWLRGQRATATDSAVDDDGLLDTAVLGAGLEVAVRRGGSATLDTEALEESEGEPESEEEILEAVAVALEAQQAAPAPTIEPAPEVDEDLDRLFD